jgi:hypothetical protein
VLVDATNVRAKAHPSARHEEPKRRGLGAKGAEDADMREDRWAGRSGVAAKHVPDRSGFRAVRPLRC